MTRDVAPVSVIVPAWRACATIGRALESIAAQTQPPAEVIVIDDGSDDGTAAAAKNAARVLRLNARVIEADHRGAGAARNRGLALSAQPLVAFLDADDAWLPDKIERTLPHLADPTVVLVAHDALKVATGQPASAATPIAASRRHAEPRDPYLTLYRKGHVVTSSVIARRDALVSAGGFDETLPTAQDFELWLAVLAEPGRRFVVFGEALVRYYVSPQGITANTARRLWSALRVAARFAPLLRARASGAWRHVAFRAVAVHAEAVASYRVQGARVKASLAAAATPLSVACLLACLLFAPARARNARSFPLAPTRADASGANRVLRVALWLWVALALALYVLPLVPLIDPVLRTLGLS